MLNYHVLFRSLQIFPSGFKLVQNEVGFRWLSIGDEASYYVDQYFGAYSLLLSLVGGLNYLIVILR